MSATRTLPSSWRARPFQLPLASDIRSSVNELLADVQDSLENCEPGGRAEQVDRPLEAPPRREDETGRDHDDALDRKSTRLNSSHVEISYAVFCLKKKKKKQ